MEKENVKVPATKCSRVIPAEVESTQITEEGPRVCPLCNSEIRFFFINFNEKMLMCENIECEFPFGYEDLQFLRLQNDEDINDVISIQTKPSHTSNNKTGSVISTASWSEIDKINRVYESEDSQVGHRSFDNPKHSDKRRDKKKSKNVNVKQKNVDDIKGLNMELMEIAETSKIIRNEKWIKNLMSLEGRSGMKLVKPEELKQVQKDNKELKIDIDKSSDISTIKIQIAEA